MTPGGLASLDQWASSRLHYIRVLWRQSENSQIENFPQLLAICAVIYYGSSRERYSSPEEFVEKAAELLPELFLI